MDNEFINAYLTKLMENWIGAMKSNVLLETTNEIQAKKITILEEAYQKIIREKDELQNKNDELTGKIKVQENFADAMNRLNNEISIRDEKISCLKTTIFERDEEISLLKRSFEQKTNTRRRKKDDDF